MKKWLSLFMGAMIFAMVLCGCSKQAEPAAEQPPAENSQTEEEELTSITIGYAALDESQEHLIPVGDNIEKVAKEMSEELGIEIRVIRVDNAGDGAKAVENVDNLLLQGIDVIEEFNLD